MFTDLQECADIGFLGLTVWREARGESLDAKLAVAYSIMDRVEHPSWWGDSVLQVVGKRLQYSSMTAHGDPNLTAWPVDSDASWQESLLAASTAYSKTQPNPAPNADSYFDVSIAPPAWAKPQMFVKQIGRLRFYDLNRDFEKEAGALI